MILSERHLPAGGYFQLKKSFFRPTLEQVGALLNGWTVPFLMSLTCRACPSHLHLGWVSSLQGCGKLLEADWQSLIPADRYRQFGDCITFTVALLGAVGQLFRPLFRQSMKDQQRSGPLPTPTLPPGLPVVPSSGTDTLSCT